MTLVMTLNTSLNAMPHRPFFCGRSLQRLFVVQKTKESLPQLHNNSSVRKSAYSTLNSGSRRIFILSGSPQRRGCDCSFEPLFLEVGTTYDLQKLLFYLCRYRRWRYQRDVGYRRDDFAFYVNLEQTRNPAFIDFHVALSVCQMLWLHREIL